MNMIHAGPCNPFMTHVQFVSLYHSILNNVVGVRRAEGANKMERTTQKG